MSQRSQMDGQALLQKIHEIQRRPIEYLDLPESVRAQEEELAAAAINLQTPPNHVYSIYEAVPQAMRERNPNMAQGPIASIAVMLDPRCYTLVPESVKQGNWPLLNLALNILSEESLNDRIPWQVQLEIIRHTPRDMARCLIHYWLQHPACPRKTFFTRAFPEDEKEGAPRIGMYDAIAWLVKNSDHADLVYKMLPSGLKTHLPDLVNYVIDEKHPEWLSDIAPASLDAELSRVKPILYVKAFAYSFLPSIFRESHDELAHDFINQHILTHHLPGKWIIHIPRDVFNRHPGWADALLRDNDRNFQYLPLEFQIGHPEMAVELVTRNIAMYKTLHEELKLQLPELAAQVVSIDPSQYTQLPMRMRDINRATTPAERRLVLELARLAARRDARTLLPPPAHLTPPEEIAWKRRMTLKSSAPVSSSYHWDAVVDNRMPEATQEALLEHLYTSGEHHQHLRDMDKFDSTRNSLLARRNMYSSLLKASQRSDHPIRNMNSNLHSAMLGFLDHPHSKIDDHETWGRDTVRQAWAALNKLLYNCRHILTHSTDEYLDDPDNDAGYHRHELFHCYQMLQILNKRFLAPEYAWSVSEFEEPIFNPHRPLTPEQQQFAAWVADQMSEILSAIFLARDILNADRPPILPLLSSGVWTAFNRMRDTLPPPASPLMAQRVRTYLTKLARPTEKTFFEDYPP